MNKQNVEIYNHFYNMVIEKAKVYYVPNESEPANNELPTLSDAKKSEVIDTIFNTMDFEYVTAIRTYIHNSKYSNLSVWKNCDKKKILKKYEVAWKKMYYPNNIAIAVPWFYTNIEKEPTVKILESDFGGRKYIITALNRSGIIYKSQLKKHLSLGWRFLWTIPGIGDGARWTILEAIDKGYLKKSSRGGKR